MGGATGGGYHLTVFIYFLVVLYIVVSCLQSLYLGVLNMMAVVSVWFCFIFYVSGLFN